ARDEGALPARRGRRAPAPRGARVDPVHAEAHRDGPREAARGRGLPAPGDRRRRPPTPPPRAPLQRLRRPPRPPERGPADGAQDPARTAKLTLGASLRAASP